MLRKDIWKKHADFINKPGQGYTMSLWPKKEEKILAFSSACLLQKKGYFNKMALKPPSNI